MSDICASEHQSVLAACFASIRRTFPDHLPFYFTALIFGAATIVVSQIYRIPLPFGAVPSILLSIAGFGVLGVCVAALIKLIALFCLERPDSPSVALLRWIREHATSGDRIGNIVHTVIPIMPLAISFCALKDEIPRIQPFSWDPTFRAWDLALGFGYTTSEIVQPLLNHPSIIAALNFVYDGWFVLMFACLLWQGFSSRGSALRTQFLLAFSFAWFLGGNVLATVFSSAGPCYYGYLVPGANPYAEQMALLRSASAHWPIWSIQIQDMLWSSYETGRGDISGISAMPSMHVMIAVMLALLGWRVDRRLGFAFGAFAALIVVGSIVLGWHYAVDGIAAIGLAVFFWTAAGWCARGWRRYVSHLRVTPPSAVAAPAQ